jgi:hypothetical protein
MTKFGIMASVGLLALAACTTPGTGVQDFAPVNHDLDGLSSLTTNEQVQLSGGQTAHVEGVWESALGQQCMRLSLTPAQTREVACHGSGGWYTLRDVTMPGGT